MVYVFCIAKQKHNKVQRWHMSLGNEILPLTMQRFQIFKNKGRGRDSTFLRGPLSLFCLLSIIRPRRSEYQLLSPLYTVTFCCLSKARSSSTASLHHEQFSMMSEKPSFVLLFQTRNGLIWHSFNLV